MKTGQSTLGVVAISFNEEEDLPFFLENLVAWVDEIVIVDDGSTDETARIAEAAGEKVRFLCSPRESGEFYSDQRNKGIGASSSEWLIHMDIDERVSRDLASEIRAAIDSGGADAYRFRRRNYFLHRPMRGGGWQSWNQVHLARRDALRFGGMFHESCELSSGTRVGQLSGLMNHLNDADYEERIRKSHSYHEEVVSMIRASGRRVTWRWVVLDPLITFAKVFIWKCGYRDGTPGLIFALHSAIARFRAIASVWSEQNRIERTALEKTLIDQWRDESPPRPIDREG